MALCIFHEAAERVPAYKDFLSKRKIYHKNISTISDFRKVPLTDKDNYLRKYDRKDLCWDGDLKGKSWVISATSGSTGEPFYFPRTSLQDNYYALTAELYLRENFDIQNKSTLYIDAFAMGIWIGGIFTYEAIKIVSSRGYAISVATPGINVTEVINTIKNVGNEFDQIILGCYPPILKDIVDQGTVSGVNWSDLEVGIVFSAEGFSEQFRDYIIEKADLSNKYSSTLNHYGTVDLGTMSHETPLTIKVRRDSNKDSSLKKAIFGGTDKQPTLTQFVPEMFYFEEVSGNIICTSDSGYPLIRYDLKDVGGVMELSELQQTYESEGRSLKSSLESGGINTSTWNLPIVYLYERADFSVTFSGAQLRYIQKKLNQH